MIEWWMIERVMHYYWQYRYQYHSDLESLYGQHQLQTHFGI